MDTQIIEFLREDIHELKAEMKAFRKDLRRVQDFKLKIITASVLISSGFGIATMVVSLWLRHR